MRPKKPIIVLSRRTHLAHGMVRPLCPGENLPGEPSWLVRMPCYIQPPPLFCGRHQGWICFFTEQQARNLGIHSFEHMGSQKLKKRGQAVIETGFEARGGPATNRYRLGTIFFSSEGLTSSLSLSLSPIGWHTVGRRQPVAAAACEPAACRREQFTHAFHETHFARSHRPHTRRAAHLLVPHNSTSPPLELGAPHLLFRAREIPVLHYSTYIVRPPSHPEAMPGSR